VIEVPHVDFRVHKDLRYPDKPHTIFFSQDSLCRLLVKFGFDIKYLQTLGEAYPYHYLPPVLKWPRSDIKKSLSYRQLLKRLLVKLHLASYVIGLRKNFRKLKNNKAVKMDLDLNYFNDFKNYPGRNTIRVAVTLRSDRVL
jgi:hypothetical protein